MPTYHGAGVTARLSVCSLAASTDTEFIPRDKHAHHLARANNELLNGRVLAETAIPLHEDTGKVEFVGPNEETPFLLVRAGASVDSNALERRKTATLNNKYKQNSPVVTSDNRFEAGEDALSSFPTTPIISDAPATVIKERIPKTNTADCQTISTDALHPHPKDSQSLGSTALSSGGTCAAREAKALCVSVELAPQSFNRAVTRGKSQDINVDVFINGLFVGRRSHHARQSASTPQNVLHFSGYRCGRVLEYPLLVHSCVDKEPSVESLQSAQDVWYSCNAFLAIFANNAGPVEGEFQRPTSQYLDHISRLGMPESLKKDISCSDFNIGIVDVVVSLGRDKKHAATDAYLKDPQPSWEEDSNSESFLLAPPVPSVPVLANVGRELCQQRGTCAPDSTPSRPRNSTLRLAGHEMPVPEKCLRGTSEIKLESSKSQEYATASMLSSFDRTETQTTLHGESMKSRNGNAGVENATISEDKNLGSTLPHSVLALKGMTMASSSSHELTAITNDSFITRYCQPSRPLAHGQTAVEELRDESKSIKTRTSTEEDGQILGTLGKPPYGPSTRQSFSKFAPLLNLPQPYYQHIQSTSKIAVEHKEAEHETPKPCRRIFLTTPTHEGIAKSCSTLKPLVNFSPQQKSFVSSCDFGPETGAETPRPAKSQSTGKIFRFRGASSKLKREIPSSWHEKSLARAFSSPVTSPRLARSTYRGDERLPLPPVPLSNATSVITVGDTKDDVLPDLQPPLTVRNAHSQRWIRQLRAERGGGFTENQVLVGMRFVVPSGAGFDREES